MRLPTLVAVIACAYAANGYAQDPPKPVIAVLEFETIGVEEEHLGRAISEKVNADLVATNQFVVVERAQVQRIFDEQSIQLTGAVDEATAVEIGRLLGAQILVMGSIGKIGRTYNISVRFVDCETGRSTLSKTARAQDPDVIFEMLEDMVNALVDRDVERRDEKNPRSALFYSSVLPGAGQAYAGSSVKRILAFAIGATATWNGIFYSRGEWKDAQRNADYLYSLDPTGNDSTFTMYDDEDRREKTGSEWRKKENEYYSLHIGMVILTAAVHIWAAVDASGQAKKYNRERGFLISMEGRRESVHVVLARSF